MNNLKNITVTQFRNFTYSHFEFKENVVGITGLNGIGKTNLLDAIYYLCFTKSYFQSRDKYNVQHEQNGFRIEGKFQADNEDQTIACIWKEGKKTISCNKSLYERISDHIGKFAAVMIAPDDSEIITGGGEYRRKFFDGILCLNEPQYLHHLLQYSKILQQKNAYLKLPQAKDQQLLDIYDEQLAYHGQFIIEQRTKITTSFPEWLQHYYQRVSSNEQEQPKMVYEPNVTASNIGNSYKQNRWREIEAKRTLSGPHLDDWQFYINQSQCKAHSSQGQKKSYLISLKLAQIKLLSHAAIKPILLLDDIFEKLDPIRLTNLFQLLKEMEFAQIFMTHTNSADILKYTDSIYPKVQIIEL